MAKPRIKMCIKQNPSVFAVWDKDDGELSAVLDEPIKRISLKMEDGTVHIFERSWIHRVTGKDD